MKIKAEFSGGLEYLFNDTKTLDLDLPCSGAFTIKDLIAHLERAYLSERSELFVLDDGSVRPGILVLHNNTDWELEDGADTRLSNGSIVTFISTLHGGLLVDPVQPRLVLSALQKIHPSATVAGVLTTHHHHDHAGGNLELSTLVQAPIFGGDERIPALTHMLWRQQVASWPFPQHFNTIEHNQIQIGTFQVVALLTPGHTRGSLCYLITAADGCSEGPVHLFTGDTLFLAGCGRLFDGGKAEELLYSLRLLRSLKLQYDPEKILIYPGHEYTLQNVLFALQVDPGNLHLLRRLEDAQQQEQNYCSVPGTLALELLTNPFLRVEYEPFI